MLVAGEREHARSRVQPAHRAVAEGRLGFVTATPNFLLVGEERRDGGFSGRLPRLCDAGLVAGMDPDGYEESDGGWTILYLHPTAGMRLYREHPLSPDDQVLQKTAKGMP